VQTGSLNNKPKGVSSVRAHAFVVFVKNGSWTSTAAAPWCICGAFAMGEINSQSLEEEQHLSFFSQVFMQNTQTHTSTNLDVW